MVLPFLLNFDCRFLQLIKGFRSHENVVINWHICNFDKMQIISIYLQNLEDYKNSTFSVADFTTKIRSLLPFKSAGVI